MFQLFHDRESDFSIYSFAEGIENLVILNLKIISERRDEMEGLQFTTGKVSFLWLRHLWNLVSFQ